MSDAEEKTSNDEARAEIDKKYEKLLAAATGTETHDLEIESDNTTEPEYQKPSTSNIVDMMLGNCLLYTSPSPRDGLLSRMPSSA